MTSEINRFPLRRVGDTIVTPGGGQVPRLGDLIAQCRGETGVSRTEGEASTLLQQTSLSASRIIAKVTPSEGQGLLICPRSQSDLRKTNEEQAIGILIL